MQIVEAMDRYCAENELEERSVELGDAIFVKGLQYVEYPLVHEPA